MVTLLETFDSADQIFWFSVRLEFLVFSDTAAHGDYLTVK